MEHINLCLFGEDTGGQAGEAAAPVEAPQTPASREEAFGELISGEYREEYAKRTQQLIDTRFKQSKELENRMNGLSPVLEKLAQRYGMDAAAKDFPQRVLEALTNDTGTAYQAPAAEPSAPEVETPAEEPAEAEPEDRQSSKELLRRLRAQEAARFITRTEQRWQQEAQQLRSLYPGFDLGREVNGPGGPRLLGMLRSGVPLRTAYQALHMDELMHSAIGYAVENTRRRTVDSIRARGLRPEEAAAGSPTAAAQILGADPARWNEQEMNDAIRQARMGKKIYL